MFFIFLGFHRLIKLPIKQTNRNHRTVKQLSKNWAKNMFPEHFRSKPKSHWTTICFIYFFEWFPGLLVFSFECDVFLVISFVFAENTQEKPIDNQQKPIKPSNKNIKHKENLFQDSSACNGNVLETLFSLIVFFCFSFCRFLEVWWFFIVFQFLFFWLLSCFMKHGWQIYEGQSNRQQQSK